MCTLGEMIHRSGSTHDAECGEGKDYCSSEPKGRQAGGLGWKYRSGECMPGEGEKADVSGSSDRIQGAHGMSF